jgi:acyl-CoA synthetase (NDP forming)
VDITKLLLYLPPVRGSRIGIISMNGGQCVAMADIFTKAGLGVPLLAEKSYEQLSEIFASVGASYKNPIDMGLPWYLFQALKPTLEILGREERIDAIVIEIPAIFIKMAQDIYPDFANMIYGAIFESEKKIGKPLLVMLPPSFKEEAERDVRKEFPQGNIPTFSSYSRGAKALKKVVDYYRFHIT